MKNPLFIPAIVIFIFLVIPDTAYACKSDNDCSQVLKKTCAMGIYGLQCMNIDTANYYRKQMEENRERMLKNRRRKNWGSERNNEKLALAFCWQNRTKLWFCDGKTQKAMFGHKNLDKALSLAGCKKIKKGLRWSDDGNVGRLFMCEEKINPKQGTGKLTSNRDIRGWRTIPIGW